MRDFIKMHCWNLGMEIVGLVYELLERLPSVEKYGLRSQISRSAISMPSNIAEGSSRSSNKDTARFFEIAIGSAFEIETQILVGQKAGFFSEDDVKTLLSKVVEFQRKTNSYRLKILTKQLP